MTQENKIVIEIPHPIEQMKRISKALNDIKNPGSSMAKIKQSTMVFKEVEAQDLIFKAYVSYLKFRVKVMEKKIRELERKESDA